MPTTNAKSGHRPVRRSLAALTGLILISPVQALEFDPGVRVSGIYSDNIFLDPDDELSDFVAVLAPGIGIFHNSDRIDLEVDYLYEYLWYNDLDSTADFHNGDARLDLGIVPQRLLLESFASIAQVAVDPTQPIPRSSIPLSTNRTDVISFETAPHWIQPIGSTELDARIAFGTFRYDSDELEDTDYLAADTTYRGPLKNRGIEWAVNHEYRRAEYEISPVIARRQLLQAELGYVFNEFSVFGAYGKESSFLDIEDDGLEDNIWRAGVRRKTAASSFEAFYGERSFGNIWGLSYDQSIKNGSVSLSFSQQPSSTEEVYRANRPRPGSPPTPGIPVIPEVPGEPPDINVPGTGERFVRTFANATFARVLNNNELALRVFYDRREDGVLLDGTPQDINTQQIGVIADWKITLGARTMLGLNAGYRYREADADDADRVDDDFANARVTLSRQLGRKLDASIFYIFRKRAGEIAANTDYSANEIGINVNWDFGTPILQRRRR